MDTRDIGEMIKSIRKSKGITQQQLADKIGKTESSIRKYEKGLVQIPINVMNDIATALEVPVQDLLQFDESKDSFQSEREIYINMLENNTILKQNLDLLSNKNIECISNLRSVLTALIDDIPSMLEKTDAKEYNNLLSNVEEIVVIIDILSMYIQNAKWEDSNSSLKEISEFAHFKYEKLRKSHLNVGE